MPYYAVGTDFTTSCEKNPDLFQDLIVAGWHFVYNGRTLVALLPRTFDLWRQAHTEPVTYEELEASLVLDNPVQQADLEASLVFENPEMRRVYLRDVLLSTLAFVAWPWYESDSCCAQAGQLLLADADALPNPEPTVFSERLWHQGPPLSRLERAYRRTGASPEAARQALIDQIPTWLAASGGAMHWYVMPDLPDPEFNLPLYLHFLPESPSSLDTKGRHCQGHRARAKKSGSDRRRLYR